MLDVGLNENLDLQTMHLQLVNYQDHELWASEFNHFIKELHQSLR